MDEIFNCDCIEGMRELPSDSVDAIVTDPPYGLNFMGKDWDHGVPGEQFWSEALRVAKPGAYLLSFGGTRTYHRLACAIEDSGWEIRDCLGWLYGCLSEDTEVLVNGKWEHYDKVKVNSLALGYDIATGEFSWQRIEDSFLYDYDDTAYRISSDFTDQLVSRNHRVVVERGGVAEFRYAEEIAREREACVPFLESVQDLLNYLPLSDEGASNEEQVLQPGMSTRICASQDGIKPDVSSMRKDVQASTKSFEPCKCPDMLKALQRDITQQGISKAQLGRPSALDRGIHEQITRENDRRDEPIMEGRSDLSCQARELCVGSICEMPKGVCADVSERWICNGTSFGCCSTDRSMSYENRNGSPYQSQSVRQSAEELNVIQNQQRPQAVRSTRKPETTLARITPVHYIGKVWCITVKTHAFVARRNGKIFITGNSGFPKSMDVSKAIDKSLGKKREVVGFSVQQQQQRTPAIATSVYGDYKGQSGDITSPASEAAKKWQGWGTALKPAWEPIIMARKPLDGTVAHNVMTYGTGAINIDACRVGTENMSSQFDRTWKQDNSFGNGKRASRGKIVPDGRFPANIIHDGSDEATEPMGNASRFFYCAKASKKERGEGNVHPTVKPQALMQYLIKLVTPEGAVVLDPFLGSGSTAVAAMATGRHYLGYEILPEYFEIARARLDAAKMEDTL